MNLIVFIALTAQVVAWDAEGHRVIARIAGKLIGAKALRYLYDHIGEPTDRSVKNKLAFISDWADIEARSLYPETRELHYAFMEYRNCEPFDAAKHCGLNGNGKCIVTGIADYAKRAIDSSLSREKRAEALKLVIHFVADAHQPLHLGFEKDRGGNLIKIGLENPSPSTQVLPENLHKVWDSYLLDSYRVLEVVRPQSWWSLGSGFVSEIYQQSQIERSELVSVESAYEFAAAIVSETAAEVTCNKAYTDENGQYIKPGDVLSDAYIDNAMATMKQQFIRAGVRLAQMINLLGSTYYESLKQSAPVSPVSVAVRNDNPYLVLAEVDFDEEELAYFVDLPPSEAEVETTVADVSTSTGARIIEVLSHDEAEAVDSTKLSLEEKRRRKNAKKRERTRAKKRRVFGIDIDALVLLRRPEGRLYITEKKRVISDDFQPFAAWGLTVRSPGSLRPVSLLLDADVFGIESMRTEVFQAMIRHLHGLPDPTEVAGAVKDPGNTVAVAQSASEEAAIQSAAKSVVRRRSCINIIIDRFETKELGRGYTSVNRGKPFSSIEKMVAKRPTDAEIRKIIGPHAKALPEPAVNHLLFQKLLWPRVFAVSLLGIKLFTAKDFIQDRTNCRWIFNVFPVHEETFVLVDVRLFDWVPHGPTLDAGNDWADKHNKVVTTMMGGIAPIVHALLALGSIVTLLSRSSSIPSDLDAEVGSFFEQINIISRPERLFPTIEFILRTDDERGRTMVKILSPRLGTK